MRMNIEIDHKHAQKVNSHYIPDCRNNKSDPEDGKNRKT